MSHGTTVCNVCMHTLCCLCLHVWCQARYLLQCCQGLVHSQSISQGSGSRISNSIPSKTVEESTPELMQVEKIKWNPLMFNPRPILGPLTRKGSVDTWLNENSLTQEESMIVVWSSFHMTMLVTKTLYIDSPGIKKSLATVLKSRYHHSMTSITGLHSEESDQSVVQLRSPRPG